MRKVTCKLSKQWNRIMELASQGKRMDALGNGLSSDVENLQRVIAHMESQYLEKAERSISVCRFGEEQLLLAPQ
jgi:hypothetical protein